MIEKTVIGIYGLATLFVFIFSVNMYLKLQEQKDSIYNVENIISELNSFKTKVSCDYKIGIMYELPDKIEPSSLPLKDLARYSLSPCKVSVVDKLDFKGYVIINRLHSEYDKHSQYVIAESPNKEFILLELK